MKKSTWKSRIKKACKTAGTYQPFFDAMINSLAEIMELRDRAQECFEESGGKTVVSHVNKDGTENQVKNPAFVALMDCNGQALAYWKELGLTPAGLKKINENGLKVKSNEPARTMLDIVRAKKAGA